MSTQASNDQNIPSPKTLRVVSERHPRLPVTPQRLNVHKQARAVSSPLTPANNTSVSSPFTPITNVYSSTANTPISSSSSCTKVEISPENQRLKQKSLADSAPNWRTRAKENGIKVSNSASNTDQASPNDLLPSSFQSTSRRSRQTLFQTNSTDGALIGISPRGPRLSDQSRSGGMNPSSLSNMLLATPEPPRSLSGSFGLNTPSPQTSSAIIQSLRQRGCQTDPARTRRRETFGGETSFNSETLFDIDEDASITSSPRAFSPYSRGYSSPLAVESIRGTMIGNRSVSAPFTAFKFNLDESDGDEDDSDLDEAEISLCMSPRSRTTKLRAVRSVSTSLIKTRTNAVVDVLDVPSTPEAARQEHDPDVELCSVCSAPSSATPLSALKPCEHRICSSCLTGALNIIGEKDMTCAVCEQPVQDFKLLAPLKLSDTEGSQEGAKETVVKLLPSAFSAISPQNSDKASTASPASNCSRRLAEQKQVDSELSVLRIDNVPWDVTPRDLRMFFSQHNVVRAHVLLDPKGKTLSHAYVEVAASDAPAALRSTQNKPLGRDKRRRAVTVTMSSQSELMRALFPSWLGSFDGCRPTLSGLDQSSVATALSTGVLSATELENLTVLMQNPKSHFLKSPCLPFYSLISILSKFPADTDSRVFWSAALRDVLFQITYAAATTLVQRLNTEYADEELLQLFLEAAIDCQAFTDIQRQNLIETANSSSPYIQTRLPNIRSTRMGSVDGSIVSEETYSPDNSILSSSPHIRYPSQLSASSNRPHPRRQTRVTMSPMTMASPLVPRHSSPHINMQNVLLGASMSPNASMNMASLYSIQAQSPHTPYQSLAHEFGVDPELIAAVAQRLAIANVGAMNMQNVNAMGMFGMM